MSLKRIKVAKKSANLKEQIPNLLERYKLWLDENPYPVLATLVVIVVLAAGYWGFNTYRGSRETSARAGYVQALKNWPGDEAASDSKAMETTASELEKYVSEHSGTRSAFNARLDLARAYFQLHRFDDALKQGKTVLDKVDSGSDLKALARYQVALTYQAMGKADEALGQWKALKGGEMPGLDREIDWYMAKIYAGKDESAKAVEQYESAIKDEGFYPSTAQLQDELSAIKLKTASATQPAEKTGAKD